MLGVSDGLLKVIDLIRGKQGIDYHEVDSFADTVRVAFFEELVASLEDLLDIVVVLLVEAQSPVDHSRTLDHAVGLEAHTLEPKVLGVSFKVV